MSSQIALLIDAENISYKAMPDVFKQINPHGHIAMQAVYGDWKKPHLQTWYRLAKKNKLKVRHQTNHPNTKNSTDMKLIMDAMDILFQMDIDIFCLVTNDADYIPLCDKVHEAQKYVIGIGYQHASEAFIRSCDQFIFVKHNEQSIATPPHIKLPVETSNEVPQYTLLKPFNQQAMEKLFKKAFTISPEIDGWVSLSALGSALRHIDTNFHPVDYGYANLSRLLEIMLDFVELKNDNNDAYARLKNRVVPAKSKSDELENILIQAFEKVPQTAGKWVTLSALGTALKEVKKSFKTKSYGHSNLSKLLQSMPYFVEVKTQGKVIRFARLKANNNAKQPKLGKVEELISKAFDEAPQDTEQWVSLSALGSVLSQIQPGFKSKTYGYSTLSKLLLSMPNFVQLKTNDKVHYARVKK